MIGNYIMENIILIIHNIKSIRHRVRREIICKRYYYALRALSFLPLKKFNSCTTLKLLYYGLMYILKIRFNIIHYKSLEIKINLPSFLLFNVIHY